MHKIPQKFLMTFDEFCFLTHDKKADLLDGVIWMAAPEMTDTNGLWMWLMGWFHSYIEEHSLGNLYGPKIAFRFDNYNAPEPDLAFFAKKRQRMRRPNYINGPPDLIAEIVVPDSIERDYVLKKRIYAQHGVREYWLIDEIKQRVILWRLNGRGKYDEVPSHRGELRSEVIAGFWLKPAWLWQQRRPLRTELFRENMQTARI